MPGRKKPAPTEEEKEREYWLAQKRGYGEKVQGDLAEDLDEKGDVGEVKERREKWHVEQERQRVGPHASRPDEP